MRAVVITIENNNRSINEIHSNNPQIINQIFCCANTISVKFNEPTIIFEHDAVIVNEIPSSFNFNKVMTISKPSYGKFNIPSFLGSGPLVQKRYFGGAHGYVISPTGAKELLKKAETNAGPTDTFLNLDNFPFLQEHNPWLVVAKDTFTTIQNERGCRAKDLSHMVEPNKYEII